MYDCVQDPTLEGDDYFLKIDTSTPCQYRENTKIDATWFATMDYIDWHAAIVGVVMGLGFPLYIFTTLRRHKRKGKLTADSPYTALFEWYIPAHCAFEVVQMIRKGGLILATAIPYNRFLPEDFSVGGWGRSSKLETRIQAYSILWINVLYAIIFIVCRPMVKEPSRYIRHLNLFSAAEGLSIAITVVGNFLALIGTMHKQNSKLLYGVGVLFAIINFSFAIVFVIGFNLEIRKASKDSAFGEVGTALGEALANVKVGRILRSALKNWAVHNETMSRLDDNDDEFYKTQLRNESKLILSRVKVAVEDEMKVKDENLTDAILKIKGYEEDVSYAR